MNRTLMSIVCFVACSVLGEEDPAWLGVEPFKGYPITKERYRRYSRNLMTKRQKAAFEFEKAVCERTMRLQKTAGRVPVNVELPISLTERQKGQIARFRMGSLIDSEVEEFRKETEKRLTDIQDAIKAADAAAYAKWRQDNPVQARIQDAERAAANAGFRAQEAEREAERRIEEAEQRAQQAENEAARARSRARRAKEEADALRVQTEVLRRP